MDKSYINLSRIKNIRITQITHYQLFLLLSGMVCIALCLIIALYVEYSFFYRQSRKMIELQTQYGQYIKEVKKIFGGLSEMQQDLVSYDCDREFDNSFIPVNRTLSHLKESAEDYFKEQQISSCVDQMYEATNVYQTNIAKKSVSRRRQSKRVPRPFSLTMPVKTEFLWPIDRMNFWISSYYGPRKKGFHYALDMAASRGTPVRPAAKGKVRQAGYVKGYGNLIEIEHNDTYRTRYAHLDQIYVKLGQEVQRSDVIGSVGDTGFTIKTGTDASHLHFEVCEHGKQINPLHVLPR